MNRHATDGISLAFGVLFLAAVGWWLLTRSVDVVLPRAGWFVASGLIGLGLLGVFLTTRHGSGRQGRQPPS